MHQLPRLFGRWLSQRALQRLLKLPACGEDIEVNGHDRLSYLRIVQVNAAVACVAHAQPDDRPRSICSQKMVADIILVKYLAGCTYNLMFPLTNLSPKIPRWMLGVGCTDRFGVNFNSFQPFRGEASNLELTKKINLFTI